MPKRIPQARDQKQSQALVAVVGGALALACAALFEFFPALLGSPASPLAPGSSLLLAGSVSLTFGVAVWALRAATPAAALMGAMVCLLVTVGTGQPGRPGVALFHTGLTPLMVLFLLTFLGGRMGRAYKRKTHSEAGRADPDEVREARHGRSAAQVLANLGVAGLCAWPGGPRGMLPAEVMLLAALAEATADTVSSEIGSAFGGTPYLLTTFRRVPAGTDGAVSVMGTAAGLAGALAVIVAGAWSFSLPAGVAAMAFAGGAGGLLFDSLLGATVERRGWLGNDLVNFTSTLFAAAVALGLLACR